MRTKKISTKDFVAGISFLKPRGVSTHNFRATYTKGEGIRVFDENGNLVEVEFAGTSDNRTVTDYVKGVGFIGGWQYPHRAMPWEYLAESINKGILYHDLNQLPKKFTR